MIRGLANQHVTSFAVIDSNLYAGTRDGVFLSTNYGTDWNRISNGLTHTSVTSLAVNGKYLFAGTNGGVFLSTDNGTTWDKAGSGIPDNAEINTFAINGKDIFTGTNYVSNVDGGGLYISTNNGTNWAVADSGIINTSVTSLALSGSNIFAGTYAGVFRSTDDGNSWAALKNGLANNSISALAVNGMYIFAGTDSNGVFRSNDNGSNWNTVNNGITDYKILSLFVHGKDIFAGTKGGGIFRSTDNGDSWQQMQGGFVLSLAVSGTDLFIGSSFNGVQLSTDTAVTLENVSTGFLSLPVFGVMSLASSGTELYAGTWLHGLWKRSLSEMTEPPGIPQLISVRNNSREQSLNLTLIWNKVSGADLYHLRIANDSLFKDLVLSDSALSDTLKEVNGLKEGLKYYWKVSAVNDAGKSQFSDVWSFTTILYAPDSLRANAINNKQLKLIWADHSNNETGFLIERKQTADFILLDTVKANVINYIDSAINQASTYQYRLKAYTPFAVSAYSNIVTVTPTGIENNKVIPTKYRLFQNYPDPFNSATTIQYWIPEKSYVELKIMDILGREVTSLISKDQHAGEYKVQFNSSSLASGIYIYTIHAGEFRNSKKCIVLK